MDPDVGHVWTPALSRCLAIAGPGVVGDTLMLLDRVSGAEGDQMREAEKAQTPPMYCRVTVSR